MAEAGQPGVPRLKLPWKHMHIYTAQSNTTGKVGVHENRLQKSTQQNLGIRKSIVPSAYGRLRTSKQEHQRCAATASGKKIV